MLYGKDTWRQLWKTDCRSLNFLIRLISEWFPCGPITVCEPLLCNFTKYKQFTVSTSLQLNPHVRIPLLLRQRSIGLSLYNKTASLLMLLKVQTPHILPQIKCWSPYHTKIRGLGLCFPQTGHCSPGCSLHCEVLQFFSLLSLIFSVQPPCCWHNLELTHHLGPPSCSFITLICHLFRNLVGKHIFSCLLVSFSSSL